MITFANTEFQFTQKEKSRVHYDIRQRTDNTFLCPRKAKLIITLTASLSLKTTEDFLIFFIFFIWLKKQKINRGPPDVNGTRRQYKKRTNCVSYFTTFETEYCHFMESTLLEQCKKTFYHLLIIMVLVSFGFSFQLFFL